MENTPKEVALLELFAKQGLTDSKKFNDEAVDFIFHALEEAFKASGRENVSQTRPKLLKDREVRKLLPEEIEYVSLASPDASLVKITFDPDVSSGKLTVIIEQPFNQYVVKRELSPDEQIVIGRGLDAHVSVTYPGVSRNHVGIAFHKDGTQFNPTYSRL